jgi:hypothetical protein
MNPMGFSPLSCVGNGMNLIWDVFTLTPSGHVLVLRLSLEAEPSESLALGFPIYAPTGRRDHLQLVSVKERLVYLTSWPNGGLYPRVQHCTIPPT